jgi:aminoglycoside phosphotransferase family enzyme
MNGKRWFAALLLTGAMGIAAVSAQSGSETAEPTAGITARGLIGNGDRILAQSVADAIGLEPRELLPLLRDGLTLAEIVESNGGDVEAVIADAVADGTARIAEVLANGRLTEERAEALTANLETFYRNAMSRTLGQHRTQMTAGAGVPRLAAEQTGLLPREVVAEIRDGSTLADVLTENGVEVDAFLEAAVAQAEIRLDQAVSNGRITQERADEMLNNLRERLTQRLNMSGTI